MPGLEAQPWEQERDSTVPQAARQWLKAVLEPPSWLQLEAFCRLFSRENSLCQAVTLNKYTGRQLCLRSLSQRHTVAQQFISF